MARLPKAARNAEAAAAYGLSAVRVGEINSNEHRRRTGSRRRPPLPRRRPDAQAQTERDAEIYRRTVITRELTQQEAADAFGLCIGRLLAS